MSGIPVIHVNHPSVQIESFLAVPATPARMGIRNTDYGSFIISSTPFQKTEEDKILKKQQAAIEKENRIKERNIKKEEKNKENLAKAERKRERLTKTSKTYLKNQSKKEVVAKRNLKVALKRIPQTKPLENVSHPTTMTSGLLQTVEMSNIQPAPFLQNVRNPATTTSGLLQAMEMFNIQLAPSTHRSEHNTPHVRQLFNDDNEDKDFNCIVETGICFQCAGHFTFSRVGITCCVCKYRSYHFGCTKSGPSNCKEFTCEFCLTK